MRYRAEGDEKAREIRAGADREREIILARAYEQGQRLRGDGDARGHHRDRAGLRPGSRLLRLPATARRDLADARKKIERGSAAA